MIFCAVLSTTAYSQTRSARWTCNRASELDHRTYSPDRDKSTTNLTVVQTQKGPGRGPNHRVGAE
jgi:hypothetical protein